MTNYKNDLGSVEVAGATIGEVLAYSLDEVDDAIIADTTKGNTVTTEKVGRIDPGSVSVTVQFDYDDTAQATLIDDVLAGTGTTLNVTLVTDEGEEITCTGFAMSVDEVNGDGDGIQQATLGIKLQTISIASGIGDFDTLIANDNMDEA